MNIFMSKGNNILFPAINEFTYQIHYTEIDAFSRENVFHSHIHNECEIYFNLSGNVSFMVENTIYPIQPGSIIVTPPNQFHHTIYNDNSELHRHYWILFSAAGNEFILKQFFSGPSGHQNLFNLNSSQMKQAVSICNCLLQKDLSIQEHYFYFFSFLHLLQQNTADPVYPASLQLPEDILFAMNYIHDHLSDSFSVQDIARLAHVSQNTLERHFSAIIQMTPSEYIRHRRLIHAQQLLTEGYTVQETCDLCGFSDYSHFISQFRRYFGVTPLQYKKQNRYGNMSLLP